MKGLCATGEVTWAMRAARLVVLSVPPGRTWPLREDAVNEGTGANVREELEGLASVEPPEKGGPRWNARGC